MFSASSEAILMPLVSNDMFFKMQFYPCGFTDVMDTPLDLVLNPNTLQLIALQDSNHRQSSPVTLRIIPKPFSGSCA
jgi:hypothetical protein